MFWLDSPLIIIIIIGSLKKSFCIIFHNFRYVDFHDKQSTLRGQEPKNTSRTDPTEMPHRKVRRFNTRDAAVARVVSCNRGSAGVGGGIIGL
jgi:hypothetical protein